MSPSNLTVARELHIGEGSKEAEASSSPIVVLRVSAHEGWEEVQARLARTPGLPPALPSGDGGALYDMDAEIPPLLTLVDNPPSKRKAAAAGASIKGQVRLGSAARTASSSNSSEPQRPSRPLASTKSLRFSLGPGDEEEQEAGRGEDTGTAVAKEQGGGSRELPPSDNEGANGAVGEEEEEQEAEQEMGPRVKVTDAQSWARLQSRLPSTPAQLATWQMKHCCHKARSGAYVVQLQGYHGMWELAIQSSGTDRLQAGGIFEEGRTHAHSHHQHHHHHTHMDGVWSAEEVALVVQAVAGVMRVVPKERRVGQAATGCCSLAAAWWLLRQPAARMRSAHAAPAFEGDTQQAQSRSSTRRGSSTSGDRPDGEEPPHGAGEGPGEVPGGSGGSALLRSTSSMASRSAGGPQSGLRLQLRKKERMGSTLSVREERAPSSSLLAGLLSPSAAPSGGGLGLGAALGALLRELHGRVAAEGRALMAGHRADQLALAAVWAAGLFSELMANPAVRQELVRIAQVGVVQRPATMQLAGGGLGVGGDARGGGGGERRGGAAGGSRRRVAMVMSGGESGPEGLASGLSRRAALAEAAAASSNSLLGLEMEEVYALLLSTAALPCWLCARPAAPWRLEPMGMAQAAGLIRSTLQSYLARRRREALQRAFSAKVRPGGAAKSLMQAAAAGTGASPRPTTTTPSSNAASGAPGAPGSSGKAPQATTQQQGPQGGAGGAAVGAGRLGGLTASQEAELAAAASAVSGLERYFDATCRSHVSVAAAEALLSLIQAGGPLGRDHFASFAPAGALLRLLDCTAVPCRTAHIGAVVLSAVVRPGAGADAFFAAAAAAAAAAGGQGGSGGQGGGHRGPGARRGEAHGPQLFVGGGPDLVLEMLRWLAPLTALESQEREMRLGPNEGRWYPAFRTLGPNAVRSWSPLSTPVADARWQGQGSEVSTHAAAAAWGLAAQMVKMWATEEADRRKAARAPGGKPGSVGWAGGQPPQQPPPLPYGQGGAAGPGGGGGGGGMGAPGSAPQTALERATHKLMTMAVTGLKGLRPGPATHILLCGLASLATEPSALRFMVRHGLVDAGERAPVAAGMRATASGRRLTSLSSRKLNPDAVAAASGGAETGAGSSGAAAEAGAGAGHGAPAPRVHGDSDTGDMSEAEIRREQARRLASWPGHTGVAPSRRGLVGMLIDSEVPGFLEIALALMGCTAAAGTPYDPVKGGPPGSGIGEGDQVPGSGAATAAGPTSGSTAAGHGDDDDDEDEVVPELEHGGVPARRLLMAGGWGAACTCLAAAGGPVVAAPGLAAATIMYLAKEVYLWSEVLTAQAHARRAARAAAPRSRSASRSPSRSPSRRRLRLQLPSSDFNSNAITILQPGGPGPSSPTRPSSPLRTAGPSSPLRTTGPNSPLRTTGPPASSSLLPLPSMPEHQSSTFMIAGIESSSTYLTATATSEAVSPERSLANLPPGNDPRVSVPGSPSVVRFSTGGTAIATRSSSHRFRGSALGSAAPPPAVVVAPEPEDPMGLDPALDCPGEVAKLLRCLMGEDFKTLTQALQVLTQLLGRTDQRLLQHTCLAVYHLAAVPLLRDPLGRAGVVTGLVSLMRRWVDLPPSEQRAFKATGEWAMAALVRLTADPGGEKNRYRLACSHKDPNEVAPGGANTPAAVKHIIHGFGYATTQVPGSTAQKRTGRTGEALVDDMRWGGGWGWGTKAKGHLAAGSGAAAAAATAGSLGGCGGGADSDSDDELARELAAAGGGGSKSAADPIGLLVQLTALKSKSRSSFQHIKLPALLLLRQFAGERQYRVRLVTEGAGAALATVANSSTYDGMTRAAAAALWMEVSQTPEGRDPRWWSQMAEGDKGHGKSLGNSPAPARKGAAAAASAPAPAAAQHMFAGGGGADGGGSGEDPARLCALSRMVVSMLGSTEAEQQLVGARAAAGLLCEGEGAKAVLLAAGGLGALLGVAGQPLVPPSVLAAATTALLNLSSYVPAQVDICQRCARLLLHINARFTGFHGYLIAQQGLAAAATATGKGPGTGTEAGHGAASRAGGGGGGWSDGGSAAAGGGGGSPQGGVRGAGAASAVSSAVVIEPSMLSAVEEVLYSSSGALQNLSCHPGNRDLLYRLELEVRTRGAIADVAAEAAARVPNVPGLSRPRAAAALLSGELRPDGSTAIAMSAGAGYGAVRRASYGSGSGSYGDEDDYQGGGTLSGGPSSGASVSGRFSSGVRVPHYMRREVEQYVQYGSYLQEKLSRPLYTTPGAGGGSTAGDSGWGGDSASHASALTGGGISSIYTARTGGVKSVAFSVAGYPAPSRTEDDPDRYRAASDDGEGGPGLGEQEAAFPQLATLRVHLSKPTRSMWAPLLVDRHDGMALPLFGVNEPTEQGAPVGAGPGGRMGSMGHSTTSLMGDGSPYAAGGGGLAGSEAGQGSGVGGGVGGSTVMSSASGLTQLQRPGSTTRWAPAVKAMQTVLVGATANGNGHANGGQQPGRRPGSAGPGAADGDGMEVRLVFDTHCPHPAAARVRGFRPVAGPVGAAAGAGNSSTPRSTSDGRPPGTPTSARGMQQQQQHSQLRQGLPGVQAGAGGGGDGAGKRFGGRQALNARPSTAPPQRARGGRGQGQGQEGGGPGVGAAAPMVDQVAEVVRSLELAQAQKLQHELSAVSGYGAASTAGGPPASRRGTARSAASFASRTHSLAPSGKQGQQRQLGGVGGGNMPQGLNALRHMAARQAAGQAASTVTGSPSRPTTAAPSSYAPSVGASSYAHRTAAASVSASAPHSPNAGWPSPGAGPASRAAGARSTVTGWSSIIGEEEAEGPTHEGVPGAGRGVRGGWGGSGFGWTTEAGRQQIRDFEAPPVAMWSAVPGSKLSEELYPTYYLQDGHPVHVYRRRKDRVDELRPAGLPATTAPDASAGSYAREEAAALSLLHRAGELPLEPVPPAALAPPPPPRPDGSCLADPRDFVTLRVKVTPKVAPEPPIPAASYAPPGPWRGLKASVFKGRTKENDSKGFVNRPGIEYDIFDKDWARANAKQRFKSLLAKGCPGGPAQMDAVRACLRERYGPLVLLFDYYSTMCAGSADPFAMHLVAWGALMQASGVPEDGGGRGVEEAGGSCCRAADLDRIFLAANFEEDKTTEESKANLDNALMRFEFIEALLRTAQAKFMPLGTAGANQKGKKGKGTKGSPAKAATASGEGGDATGDAAKAAADGGETGAAAAAKVVEAVTDLSVAIRRLLDEHLVPNAPPGSLVDPNTFRETRLYVPDVDYLLESHTPVLKAVYAHYKVLARDSGDARFLDLPEWLELLGEGRLYHAYFTVREARLAFVWSRMRYYDELASVAGKSCLSRSRALSYIEFLEALGRVADLISPPPPEELRKLGFRGPHATSSYYEALRADAGLLLPDRPSAQFEAPKSRPLAEKMEQILDVLLNSLMELFGANTTDQLIAKLKQPRPRGYKIKTGGG